MATRKAWQDNWILIEDVVQSKKVATTILFSDIQKIVGDSRLVSGELRRSFEYIFKDGATYALSDTAVVSSAPPDYYEIIDRISQSIKV